MSTDVKDAVSISLEQWKINLGVKIMFKIHPVYHLCHLKEIGTNKLVLIVKLYGKHICEREHPPQHLCAEILHVPKALKNKKICNNRM